MTDFITDVQRRNRVKLADFLETNHRNISIDMARFGFFEAWENEIFPHCIASYGPKAGIEEALEDTGWPNYINRCFGAYAFYSSEFINHKLYIFLFYDEWKDFDNTALGGAARIRYFLDHENELDEYYNEFDPHLYKDYVKDASLI